MSDGPIIILDENFQNVQLVQLMNSIHFPAAAMQATLSSLVDAKIDPSMVQWGLYEKTLLPDRALWPPGLFDLWNGAVAQVRTDMATKNTDQIGNGNDSVPQTRVDLLDALIRQCFTTMPAQGSDIGIPIIENLRQKSSEDPTRGTADFRFQWVQFPNDNKASMLTFTILCRNTNEKRGT